MKYIQITRHSAGLSGLPQKHKLVFLTLKLLQLPSQAYFLKYCIFIKFLTLFVSIQIFLPSAKRLTVTPLMSLPSLSVFMMSFSLVHLLPSEITSKESFSESSLIFISRLTAQVVLFSPECETDWHISGARECSAGEHDSASARGAASEQKLVNLDQSRSSKTVRLDTCAPSTSLLCGF